MSSKVSVIVPVYNSAAYIKKCIESILRQTYKDFELILVDDGSIDHSRQVCQYYAQSDKRVLVLFQQNRGASAARNKGLEYANGEYILFVDADDWIEETLLEVVLEKSLKYNADTVVFGWKCEGNSDKRYQLSEQDMLLSGREIIGKIIDDNYSLGGGYTVNKFWNRKVLLKSGGRFDNELYAYEDKVFAINNYIYAKRVVIIPDVCYHYLIHNNSLSHPSVSIDFWKIRENILCAYKKIAEICSIDLQLREQAHIKYYAMVMETMAGALKRREEKKIEKYYEILSDHYMEIQRYHGWTIIRKLKYELIFMGVKCYLWLKGRGRKWKRNVI